jgi:WD domain, G-beta repeat
MCRSRLGEKSCAVATKANKVARAVCPLLSLALCTQAVLAQQAEKQAPQRVGVFSVPVEKPAPPQVPSGSRPPDLVFHAINSWILGALAFSADGQWLASGGYGDTVMVWNAATGAEQRRLSRPQPPNNAVVKLAFSPDGSLLLEGAFKSGIYVWKLPIY